MPGVKLGQAWHSRLGSPPSLPSLCHSNPSHSNPWLLSFTPRLLNYSPKGHQGTIWSPHWMTFPQISPSLTSLSIWHCHQQSPSHTFLCPWLQRRCILPVLNLLWLFGPWFPSWLCSSTSSPIVGIAYSSVPFLLLFSLHFLFLGCLIHVYVFNNDLCEGDAEIL